MSRNRQNNYNDNNIDDIEKIAQQGCATCSIVFFIIGLPILCMGYLNGKPPLNLANYVKVKGTILSSNMASFNHKNNILTCRYLTEFDDSCISSYTCRKKREFYYPIGSNTTLLYLPSSGYCRTKQFTNNLAYIGSSFLGLCILFCIGTCIHLRNKTEYNQILNQDELTPSNNCKYVKIYDVDYCSVCNEQFNENKYVLKKCGHIYHEKCIDIWLNKKNNCPLCQKDQTIDKIVIDV